MSSLGEKAMDLLTIGHSNHTIENFIALIEQHGVTAIGDVRSYPYSGFLPHFNRPALKKALEEKGIRYVFLGRELGARPSNPQCYVDGKAVYDKIAATTTFNEGIQKILKGLKKKQRIVLMCAEKDPLTCHRAILVCQNLRQFNIYINHILNNGDLESHTHLEDRMLAKHGFTEFQNLNIEPIQLSLFNEESPKLPTREECLEKAYQLQGFEIAYVEKRDNKYEQSN